MLDHEILGSLMKLRAAFLQANLKVPVAIVLEDADEAMRLWFRLHETGLEVRQYVDGDVMMSSVKIVGIEVRWPAKAHMSHDGEVSYF